MKELSTLNRTIRVIKEVPTVHLSPIGYRAARGQRYGIFSEVDPKFERFKNQS